MFAKVAVLPDYWRNWKLDTVFFKNHAKIPPSLQPYQAQRTASWHYINQPYPKTTCRTIKQYNVVWAINHIDKALNANNTINTNAVLMVFLEHFVGDAHQPLHTISHVNKHCKGDKGGNLFCVRKSKSGHCRENLHQLWDKGVGYLTGKSNLANKAIRLQNEFPKQSLPAVNDLSPTDWIKAEYQYAPFIYSIKQDHKPTSVYYKKGQAIARRQITLAGYRLADILNTIFREAPE